MWNRIRGLKNLVHDAVEETTNLVQRTHDSAAEKPMDYLKHVPGVDEGARTVVDIERATAGAVFGAIRAVNRGLDRATEVPLEAASERLPAPDASSLPGDSRSSRSVGSLIDQAEGALNGVIGDYLDQRGNRLGVEMGLRHEGAPLATEPEALAAALPDPQPHVVVFVHGLAATEWCWSYYAEDFHGASDVNFASLLQRDQPVSCLFVRYNTGRHVSDSGQDLSTLLVRLLEAYPIEIDQLTLVGHSMGGLVVRSAAHYAQRDGAPWVERLRRVVCIGSPHLGAPLEQAVNVVTSVLGFFDVPGTQVPAEILRARSDGIKDLRFGYTVEEEWVDRDPDALLEDNRREVPFVDTAAHYFIAGHVARDPAHPGTALLGDLLVRIPSAGGEARGDRMPFRFGATVAGAHHLHLLNHPDVYDLLERICRDAIDPAAMPHEPAQLGE